MKKALKKTGFYREHHATEDTHRDVWLLSRLAVAGGAALTVLTFGVILG